MKRNNLIVILAVILIFTACKTTKNIIKTESTLPQTTTVAEMVNRLQKEQPGEHNARLFEAFLEFQICQIDRSTRSAFQT